MLKVVDVIITDNESLSENSTVSKSATLPTVSGYTAIGCIGINIVSATTGGANWGNVCIGRLMCNTGNGTLNAAFRNTAQSGAAVFKAIVNVLYIKSN